MSQFPNIDVHSWNEDNESPRLALNVFEHALTPLGGISFYDLSNSELNGIDFSSHALNCTSFVGSKVAYARFCETRFHQVDFHRAILTASDFSFAFCDGSGNLGHSECGDYGLNFEDAILNRVVFHHTNLKHVNFRQSSLLNTKFVSSNLEHASLAGATIGGTVFSDVDLSCVNGLEKVEHAAPSYLDFQTLLKSTAGVPNEFLRGCGIPDIIIDYLPSLLPKRPIAYASCFISHASQDIVFATKLRNDLRNNGVQCWFAPTDMRIGDRIRASIDRAIRVHEKLLLIFSEDSIASRWVESEVEAAFEKENASDNVVLFPIRLDSTIIKTDEAWAADIRRTRHIGDFSGWHDGEAYEEAFNRLLHDLKATYV